MRLSKKEYEEKIIRIAPKMAEILANGRGVELGESRSGLKMYAVIRSHQTLNLKGEVNEDGR